MQSYRRTAFAERIHSLHTIFTAHSLCCKGNDWCTDAMNTIVWHSIICKNIVHSWKKVYTFCSKGIYFLLEKYILFAWKVYTFHQKSTDVFSKKYERLLWTVLMVYNKGTMVLKRKNISIKKCNLFSWHRQLVTGQEILWRIYHIYMQSAFPHFNTIAKRT